jgi:anti-sigma factor RsiW
MDHKAVKERLFALYDGELDASARQEAESHLAGCLECRELYQSWAKTARVLFPSPKIQPSEFFVHRVMDQIYALEAPRRRLSWGLSLPWIVPAVGIAAMILLAPVPPPMSLAPLSTATMLTGDRMDTDSQWMLSNKQMRNDEVLGFVMEGSS